MRVYLLNSLIIIIKENYVRMFFRITLKNIIMSIIGEKMSMGFGNTSRTDSKVIQRTDSVRKNNFRRKRIFLN